jgi:hypothetical protein
MITICEYDANWPVLFEEEAQRLHIAFDSTAQRIEHVGSTSVPTLAARAIIATLSISGSSTYYWRAKAKNNFGWGSFSQFNKFNFLLTGVGEGLSVPKEYAMSQNYPNPFNPSTVYAMRCHPIHT